MYNGFRRLPNLHDNNSTQDAQLDGPQRNCNTPDLKMRMLVAYVLQDLQAEDVKSLLLFLQLLPLRFCTACTMSSASG